MLQDRMISKYKRNYGKVLALLKKAWKKSDTFKKKTLIEPLETKIIDQFIVLENSLHKKIHFLRELKKNSENNKIELKLQGLRDSLTIISQTHNALANTYWSDIPDKAWKLFIRGIKRVRYPTKLSDSKVVYFLHVLSEYHDENSAFSILPDTVKANRYSDKEINHKKFL